MLLEVYTKKLEVKLNKFKLSHYHRHAHKQHTNTLFCSQKWKSMKRDWISGHFNFRTKLRAGSYSLYLNYNCGNDTLKTNRKFMNLKPTVISNVCVPRSTMSFRNRIYTLGKKANKILYFFRSFTIISRTRTTRHSYHSIDLYHLGFATPRFGPIPPLPLCYDTLAVFVSLSEDELADSYNDDALVNNL